MAIVSCKIVTLGGIPSFEILERVTSTLLSPFLAFEPQVYEGPMLSLERGLAPLHEHMRERPNITVRGNQQFEALFQWGRHVGMEPAITGSLSTFIKQTKGIAVDALVEMVIEAVELLHAPFGYVDVIGEGYRARHTRHREIYQEGRVGAARRFGFHAGFSGIPWRTVLGAEFVNYFGSEPLKALPARLAQQVRDDVWLLTPCEPHDEWRPERWCAGEAEIVAALGTDHFFNPQTETPAKKGVKLPQLAPIPVKAQQLRQSDGVTMKVWKYFNGYTER